MSVLDRLQGQANALDDYNNKITNLMSNYDVEKGIWEQSDVAYKGSKAIANQLFSQQQIENLSLTAPAVYNLTKGAFQRYKAGKSIVPGPNEIFEGIKSFGKGRFERGAAKTLDNLRNKLPDDLKRDYDAKFNRKIPTSTDELKEHVDYLRNLGKNKAQGFAETARTSAESQARQRASDASYEANRQAREAQGRASDRFYDRPSADEPDDEEVDSLQAQWDSQNVDEDVKEAVRADETDALGGGGAAPSSASNSSTDLLDSPIQLSAQAAHNENVRLFNNYPKEAQKDIVGQFERMNLLNERNDDGSLNPEKISLQSGILADAAAKYGVPPASGVGGARGNRRGFNEDLFWDNSSGQLINRNTGSAITGTGLRDYRPGQVDTPEIQRLRGGAVGGRADEGASFTEGSSTLGTIFNNETAPNPTGTDLSGRANIPTEQQHLAKLQGARDESARVEAELAQKAQLPDAVSLQREGPRGVELPRATGGSEAPIPPPRPAPAIAAESLPQRPALPQVPADAPSVDDLRGQPRLRAQTFSEASAGVAELRNRFPPPSRPRAETISTAGGRSADLEDMGARGNLRGAYGSTQAQAQGGGAQDAQTQPSQQLRQQIDQRLSAQDQSLQATQRDIEAVRTRGEQGTQQQVARPTGEEGEPKEEETGAAEEGAITAEGAGGVAGGIAAIGEDALTLTDKNLTGGQKAGELAKSTAAIGAFAINPVLGGAVAGGEILAGGGTGAQKGAAIGKLGGELGGAALASAAVPGAGEVIMGALGIYGFIKDAVERHKENENAPPPAPPRAPQASGIAFDSAPVIDSSDFHAL